MSLVPSGRPSFDVNAVVQFYKEESDRLLAIGKVRAREFVRNCPTCGSANIRRNADTSWWCEQCRDNLFVVQELEAGETIKIRWDTPQGSPIEGSDQTDSELAREFRMAEAGENPREIQDRVDKYFGRPASEFINPTSDWPTLEITPPSRPAPALPDPPPLRPQRVFEPS